jgi:membrane dipeptidase
LAIEGGDAFEGSLDKINVFYDLGVRMTTLVHFQNNEIGDVMRAWPGKDPGPYRGGLSDFGHKAIERMENIGMVVDVAHASPATFKDILSAATKPVIDSHTNACAKENGCGRMRSWKEMELVARNGGVTCTWPMAYKTLPRRTVADWAGEILEMKRNLGIEHIGLGTDGGGYLRHKVEGYQDERDIGNLAAAMLETGLAKEDVAAYMGGNVLRVKWWSPQSYSQTVDVNGRKRKNTDLAAPLLAFPFRFVPEAFVFLGIHRVVITRGHIS